MVEANILIQTRSQKGTGKQKKVYTKGYATTKGLYDTYKWMKKSDGSYRTFKSLFTDKCIEDIKNQLNNKTVFVDALHTIATEEGILKMLKDKGASTDEISQAKEMLKQKKLPLAKITEVDVDDYGFSIATETNPYFAEVDVDHSNYYDAVTSSLLEGYLNAYSVNFNPVDFVNEQDDSGNEWTKFDKVDFYGVSYTGSPALHTNTLTEVSLRSMMEVRSQNEGGKMSDTNEKNESAGTPVEPVKQVAQAPATPAQNKISDVDVEKIVEKKLAEERTKAEEAGKAEEIKKQEQEQTKTIDQLHKDIEALSKKQEESESKRKGITPQVDKYGDGNKETNQQWLKSKTDEITKDHEEYMEQINKGVHPGLVRQGTFFKGWGQLVQLQADTMANQKGQIPKRFGESDDQHRVRASLSSRSDTDAMVISRKKEL